MKILSTLLLLTSLLPAFSSADPVYPRWTADQANQWSAQEGWFVGANYIPANAINALEMWQKETFDPITIDSELTLAQNIGMTSMRVFLHDLVWQADQAGFVQRIDLFLQIASRHHIKPIFVLFDSCWNSRPVAGQQPSPVVGVHNSGWVQSPGVPALLDPNQLPRLTAYVKGVIGQFANDDRILAWDLWNEPDGINGLSDDETSSALQMVQTLLPQVFDWARSVHPIQPLTSPVWTSDDWSQDSALNVTEKIQLSLSDVITFHSYEPPQNFESRINSLGRFGRPIICTEYMARTLGSTIPLNLPIAKNHGVSAMNWGFVAGKTQTYYPWDSWQHPYPAGYPTVWFHDLLFPDGHPFNAGEIQTVSTLLHSSVLQ